MKAKKYSLICVYNSDRDVISSYVIRSCDKKKTLKRLKKMLDKNLERVKGTRFEIHDKSYRIKKNKEVEILKEENETLEREVVELKKRITDLEWAADTTRWGA